MDQELEGAIGRKVLWRLVLPSAFFVLMGSIDRANVGFAALQMNAALGMSATAYGFGAGILFAGYLLAKYPSVLLFERIGMRRWLSIITISWGTAAAAMSLIQRAEHLYTLRVIIGFTEGGLSSGLMIYLSNWASDKYRASILAIPIAAISVAQVIGAPLSGWLLDAPNPFGIAGWRWMFLVEAIPAILLGLFAWFYFPDTPKDASWLDDRETHWLNDNVKRTDKPAGVGSAGRWEALRSPVGWLSSAIWFCLLSGNYGIMFWLPQIVRGMSGLASWEIGVIVALPWAGSGIGLFVNARHSDKAQERFLHVAIPALIGAGGLLSAYLLGPTVGGLIALIIGGTCVGCTVAPFWAIPTDLLRPASLAMGIVMINIVGSLAGATVPAMMGYLRDRTGSYLPPTLLLAGILISAAILCLVARQLDPNKSNRVMAQNDVE